MAAAKEMRHWNPEAHIGDDGYVLADAKAAVAEATAGTTDEQEMRRRGANAPRPGQRGATARRPAQRGANARRLGHVAPQRYGATRELRSVRSGRFGHQPAASEFCRKCGKSTTVDGLPVVREEALVSAVTEAMYDRMNGHGHHMELPTGYSVDPSDPKAWPFLTAFDDPKVYAMRELHALCEAHFMHPMGDSC
eukprot:jgi/Tetstr1/428929/TSEL_018905.t1